MWINVNKNLSTFGTYTGDELLGMPLSKRGFLVDKIIRERDSVVLVGDEKAGKSILAFQLMMSLTTKSPFLDIYDISKECRVSYVQIEGELADTQDRIKRMAQALNFSPEMFQLVFSPPIDLQVEGVLNILCSELQKHKPSVVIIDPVYFALSGDLSDNKSVRAFTGNLRILKDTLECALILVHHTHKARFSSAGVRIEEGKDATFGSRFFGAWPDHTLMFTHNTSNNVRTLTCATQRSGDIIDKCYLEMVQPEPLYYKEIEATKGIVPADAYIRKLFESMPNSSFSAQEIIEKANIQRRAFYYGVKELLKIGIIEKDDSCRPVMYRLKPDSTH